MSPSRTTCCRARCTAGSGTTAADSSACVYGCCGFRNSSARDATSTISPRYITATRSHRNSTVARSCVMKRHEKPMSRCRSRSRLRIEACTDTSSADTGSSATRPLGFRTRDRGLAARGFADEDEDLAAGELERDAVHRVHRAALAGEPCAGLEVLDEVLDLEDRPAAVGAVHSDPFSPGWKQATQCSDRTWCSSGICVRESSSARGQRSAKAQKLGSS